MTIIHVYFGDAQHHPIIQNYLLENGKVYDAPKKKSSNRWRRSIELFWRLYYTKNDNVKILHCHDPISLVICLLLFKRKQIIYDSHEVFSSYIHNYFLNKMMFFVENILVRLPWKVIFPSYERGSLYFKNKSKFIVIENKMQLNVPFNYVKRPALKHPKDDAINCIYSGTFTEVRCINEIITAIKLLSDKGYSIRLDLIGSKSEYLDKILSAQPININFLGRIPHAELLSRYKNYDVAFALYRPTNLNNQYCAPTKLFEHEYVGLPTVTIKSKYIDHKIKMKEFVNCVQIEKIHPEAIAQAVLQAIRLTKEHQNPDSLLWSSQRTRIIELYKK